MKMISKVLVPCLALAVAFSIAGSSASAHQWRFGWQANAATGGGEFYGVSYHGLSAGNDDFGGSSLSGLIINGTSIEFDAGSAVSLGGSKAAFDAVVAGADGGQVGHYSNAGGDYQKYAVVSLTHADLLGLGMTVGANAFTINGYGNNVDWDNWSGALSGSFNLYSPVPEPASLAMWGLGALGACVYARRRKRQQA